MVQPLMPKATAVWLLDNTALTFDQIAHFCQLHPLEIKALADGDAMMVGVSPVLNGQVTEAAIKVCEADASAMLVLNESDSLRGAKDKRYTPLARRHDRPNAIAWFLKFCPSISDADIIRIVRTTKKTIVAIKTRSHAAMSTMKPENPVGLGFCTQEELDKLLAKYASK